LSRDLARGVTFLHDHGIAHLDIKPANMVYTDEYRLQIIDFDVSVRVKDENDEIEGYNGTELWKAPEIGPMDGEGYFYSPIKADRYLCGFVFK
ncbi:kinase-like domain-containing protein, partial [Phellopilus nigrolimitatus]